MDQGFVHSAQREQSMVRMYFDRNVTDHRNSRAWVAKTNPGERSLYINSPEVQRFGVHYDLDQH